MSIRDLPALFSELQALAKSASDPRRQQELSQSILQIDDQTPALDAQLRATVLVTRGNALQEMAAAASMQERIPLLQEAIACCDRALRENQRKVNPLDWATIYGSKGNALVALASGQSGQERAQSLRDAIACYDQTLRYYRRDSVPLLWARVMSNKSSALRDLAEGQRDEAHAQTLRTAITCCDDALTAVRREDEPLGWAMIITNKGNALAELAGRQHGVLRTQTLQAGIDCYDQALSEYRHDIAPREWGTILINKSKVLRELAEGQSGARNIQTLRDAIACCDNALLAIRRDVAPLLWAGLLSNKGNALSSLAREQSGAARIQSLRDAISCYDQTLLEYRRDNAPLMWAKALSNKCEALWMLADGLNGAERFQALMAAIACCDEALLEARREVFPMVWAGILGNKGLALNLLADGQHGIARRQTLEFAIACYDQALLEYRRDNIPLIWAQMLNNKGSLLLELAYEQRSSARVKLLRDAIACYDQALLERRFDNAPHEWADTLYNKGIALEEIADEQRGPERAQSLRGAVAVYEEALTAFSPDIHPFLYRRHAYALTLTYVQQAADERTLDAREALLGKAWQAISSAISAANLLELQAPSLTFRQQEWAENARIYNLAASIRAQQGQLDEAVTLIEHGRARGLAEAAGRRNVNLTLLDDDERAQYLLAVEQVQAIEASGRLGGDPLVLVAEAHAANTRLSEVVARLRRAHPGFLQERDTSASTLAGALRRSEALVYLIPQQAGTLVLAIPHAGETRMMWLTDLTRKDIFALAITGGADDTEQRGFLPAALGWLRRDPLALRSALDALLPALGDRLMGRVASMLRVCGCHRAVLIPSGYLSVLPLHAASYPPLAGEPSTAPTGRRYACDDLAITYAPSGLTWLNARQTASQQRRVGAPKTLFVAGNPQLTSQDQPWTMASAHYLRYAEWEARQVNTFAWRHTPPLKVDLALNDQATRARVIDGLNRADAAHLALHATFDFDNPQQSAFLVAFQAKLMLRDLLDPRQARLGRLRLVVLSACQSAIGDVRRQSEEAVGLFGALLAGGAPGVIGTLWSVNDLATAALMESFTRRYLVEGQAPDAALRGAARELRHVADSAADPAERGPAARLATNNASTEPLEAPSARRRWDDLATRDPNAVDATRYLDANDLAVVARTVRMFSAIPRDHPYYWAAFVFHGASVPLDGEEHSA
jgi:CHAT domain-containing protein/tetratricopeptide (TPR) repeat protein